MGKYASDAGSILSGVQAGFQDYQNNGRSGADRFGHAVAVGVGGTAGAAAGTVVGGVGTGPSGPAWAA